MSAPLQRSLLVLLLSATVCLGARKGGVVIVLKRSEQDEAKERIALGKQPDPLVLEAPLALAVVCKDGVLLLSSQNEIKDEEEAKCLYGKEEIVSPSRIHQIDSIGTALICAGWKVDGERLAKQCRSIARDQVEWMGSVKSLGYPVYLAQETALWMAECAISDSVRALSTVGLLACCTGNNNNNSDNNKNNNNNNNNNNNDNDQNNNRRGSNLYLVDATGFYPVRAHAIGKGAPRMNLALRRQDWTTMTCQEATNRLKDLLLNPPKLPEGDKKADHWHMTNNTRVESAVLNATTMRLDRQRRHPFFVAPQ